jgi:hypothetical protein
VSDQEPGKNVPSLGVYAVAAAFLSGIPVPIVDGLLSDAARGAAFRRVAASHGVRLGAEARKALVSQPYMPKERGRTIARAARSIVQRAFVPARVATRVEMASRALVEARLFELYLSTVDRREGAPMGVHEAERVRKAMSTALRDGLSEVSAGILARLRQVAGAVVAARRSDDPLDDRAPLERVVDSLLDLAADLPRDALDPVEARFLSALEERT